MSRVHRLSVTLLAAALAASGCYGPFNLTRRLYQWNGTIGPTKWERELVFLLMVWVPVYGLATLADGIAFNAMEFWTGENPVDPPQRHAAASTRRVVRGGDEAELTYAAAPDGGELRIRQFRGGRPAGEVRMARQGERTVARDPDGRLLFAAQARADGGVTVTDGQGAPVASYSTEELERTLAKAR